MRMPVGPADDARPDQRGRDPQLLGPALAGKVDMIPVASTACAAAPTARASPRPVRRVLRRTACAHGAARGGRARAAFDAWLRSAGPAGAAPRRRRARARPRALPRTALRRLPHGARRRATRRLGPDLTHVGSRLSLGAGTSANSAGPRRVDRRAQQIKPGARMPSSRGSMPPTLPRSPPGSSSCGERPTPANRLPRPAGELRALKRAWRTPTGWRTLSAVNNTLIGAVYIATAMLFFVLAGVLALLMRAQLAVPDNDAASAPTPTTSSSPCTAR